MWKEKEWLILMNIAAVPPGLFSRQKCDETLNLTQSDRERAFRPFKWVSRNSIGHSGFRQTVQGYIAINDIIYMYFFSQNLGIKATYFVYLPWTEDRGDVILRVLF